MKKITLILTLLLLIWCWKAQEEDSKQKNSETWTDSLQESIILALWDSLTAWYNLDIKDSYPLQLKGILKAWNYNYTVQNAWVSWDTSKNLLDRIELYDDIDVDIYLLWIWSNDWLRKQSIEQMSTNINTIIDHIQKINPNWKIVLEWMQMPLNVWLKYSRDFKKTFENISKEQGVYFYEFLLEDVATKRELNLSDWIHPNKQGYRIIAQNIFNFLENKNIITK